MAKKIAVSLPDEVIELAKQAVAEGAAPSFSAFMAEALQQRVRRHRLLKLVEDLEETYGPPSEEALAWADQVIDHALRQPNDESGAA